MDKNDCRKNGQCKQPGIEYEPEGNGWPEPLVDTSNPLKYSYTNGKSGTIETKPITDIQVSDVKDSD